MEKSKAKLKQLYEVINHNATMLIVMQDHPDPDAIASAVALRKIANQIANIQCSIAHGGTVGRAENRALVKYLNLNLRPAEQIDFASFDLIAMVDTQPGTGNNSLPSGVEPDIVIDHHPCHRNTRQCRFTDIRSHYGATSTILVEYLYASGIEIDASLATALLYGIRSDTQDLGRDTTCADVNALMALYPKANKRILSQIQHGAVQREYYKYLAECLNNARVFGRAVISSLGTVINPDMVGEMADLLLRDEQIVWVLCYGFYEGKMLLSLRTDAESPPAAKVIRHIVARKGAGGGHDSYAGGQIPVEKLSKTQLAKWISQIEKSFLKSVEPSAANGPCRKLIE